MSLIFRVFATESSGLGHLTRCVLLAKKCRQLGFDVKLVCDVLHQKHLSFTDGLSIEGLYINTPSCIDQMSDANLFIKICKPFVNHLKWIIVDHYSLDVIWERTVKENVNVNVNVNVKVLSIDDLLREHACDALLDYRWRGESTYNAYKNKIPPYAAAFLGVRYAITPNISESIKNTQTQKKMMYLIY